VKLGPVSLCFSLVLFQSCNANSPETRFQLAEKLLEDKKYEAAASEFQTIVDRAANPKISLEAQIKVAEINHLYLGRTEEATKAYKEFLKRSKDADRNRKVEKVLADLQFQEFENYDEAIATYSKLLKQEASQEDKEEIIFRIGRALFLKPKFDDSVKIFEYLKTNFPQGKYFWKAELQIANALGSKGNCQEAIKRYTEMSKNPLFPADLNPLAIFGKASCLEELDELDDAYNILSSIRGTYPVPSVIENKMLKIKRRKILRRR